jgi:hypothetical protein
MSLHRYPRKSLLADYARAAVGVGVIGVPLVLADLSGLVGLPIITLWALFAAYGVRTAIRHLTTVEVSEIGIRTLGPLGRAIPWEELGDIRLRYYATRRDRVGGWMQLKVRGAGGRISLDSTLDGFDEVLARVAEAAHGRGLELNETTRENLQQVANEGAES